MIDLEAGTPRPARTPRGLPDPKYAPRVHYLLGQFAQELEAWNEAIAAYRSIVRNHPQHTSPRRRSTRLGQCHEEAGELDEALETYVTLAATYPKSPLIANVMLRISEHFYQKEDFAVAATCRAASSSNVSPTTNGLRRWPSASASATTRTRTMSEGRRGLRRLRQTVPRAGTHRPGTLLVRRKLPHGEEHPRGLPALQPLPLGLPRKRRRQILARPPRPAGTADPVRPTRPISTNELSHPPIPL